MEPGAGTHQSLRRAVAILREFTEAEPQLTVSDIARRLDLHKSTVSRILSTLADEGVVWQDSRTGRYSLGLGLVELAGVALGQIDVRAAAMPHIELLAATSGETITVLVRRGDEAVTVAHVASGHSVRHVSWIGRRIPLRSTAAGKVLLAGQAAPGDDADTPLSEPLPPGLRKELASIHRRGFATEVDEFEAGGAGIAAPVLGSGGSVVAAVAISGPSERFAPEQRRQALPSLRRAATAIAFELGARSEASA